MKVYDRNISGASPSETGRAQEIQKSDRQQGRQSGVGSDGSGDHVEFSGALGRLSRAMGDFESQRASRIQALAVEYRSGKYRPDSAATSRGIVSEALSAGTN